MSPLSGFIALALSAQPISCQPVDPATMVWTGFGYSIAMGDGHLTVHQRDVKFWNGPQPLVCLPARHGPMRLYLPQKDWLHSAHGSWDWIRKSEYKGEDGLHCCDPRECYELEAKDVREVPGGFQTSKGRVGYRATYQSEDGRTIICHPRDNGTARCLFINRGS